MDTSPLQYDMPNENEPLYRAALLSAAGVVAVIVIGLGIKYAINYVPHSTPVAHGKSLDSDDQAVSDVRNKLTQDAMSTLGTTKSGLEAIQNEGNSAPEMSPQNYSAVPTPAGPVGARSGRNPDEDVSNYSGSNRPSGTVQVSQVRDYASFSPDNLGPLLTGH